MPRTRLHVHQSHKEVGIYSRCLFLDWVPVLCLQHLIFSSFGQSDQMNLGRVSRSCVVCGNHLLVASIIFSSY